MEVIIAPKAKNDIADILDWSLNTFGPQILSRYANLIETAIAEIAADPDCIGSAARPEIAENCRTYHLSHARKKAGKRSQSIRKPRHLILYRIIDDGRVEIGRVLHESMDFERHLPDEFRDPSE